MSDFNMRNNPEDYADNSVCIAFIDEQVVFMSKAVVLQFIEDLKAELEARENNDASS